MGIKHRIQRTMLSRIGLPRIRKVMDLEKSLAKMDDIILPDDSSPTRFEIPFEMATLFQERSDLEMKHVLPIRRILSILKNIPLTVNSIANNPKAPLTETNGEFLETLKEYAKTLGVSPIGYSKLSRNLIFQEYGVKYDNAIVLAMEMDADRIQKAPSQETVTMVFETYDDLGIAANRIAEFLREHCYAAHAGHPLGGVALYPPLAQKAGIGWFGRHGMIITPEFGSRVRLAAVFTSIQNLPFTEVNEHSWIGDYCQKCGRCVRDCPPKAIYEKPVTQESGRVTHISLEDCFEYFAQFYGCTVCIKVCPFSKRPYSEIKEKHGPK